MKDKNYADIIVDIKAEKLDRSFQYRVPDHLKESIYEGTLVRVPFGTRAELLNGYVINLSDIPNYDIDKMKEVDSIVKDSKTVEGDLIQLAAWMKEQYGSTMIMALKTVMPVKKSKKTILRKEIHLIASKEELGNAIQNAVRRKNTAKLRLMNALMNVSVISMELAAEKLNISVATVNALVKDQIITVETFQEYRNPITFNKGELNSDRYEKKILSADQENIVNSLYHRYQEGDMRPGLIHGVTGSGKTEIYLSLIEKVLEEKKQIIVLIPEISLTYQTVLRFYRRFGERVGLVHSRLSEGERFDQFERAEKGLTDIMIGPRSALFTPFQQLGLIIIDEEQENSYKSEVSPKYHADEVAVYLAKMKQAMVVLGSATPSVESYYLASIGQYVLYSLNHRIGESVLPLVHTIDMREELKKGNKSIFSETLQSLIRDRLGKKEQIILFLNRRGYAGFVSCRSCGYVLKCPHCDVSLSEHQNGRLYCHYCGYETVFTHKCPECGSKYIAGFKVGTEQIEELLNREFPSAKVLRMDADTTRKKGSYQEILSSFSNCEADILLGTQMIVKGHDFPMVTLVGVLAADLSLGANDYRAGERTFQLLTQAVGRAGRGSKEGEAVIQTYQPEHYSIVDAAAQCYQDFFEEEILYRELAKYPPVYHMLAVQITSGQKREACELSKHLSFAAGKSDAVLIGPTEAGIGKINDRYRYVFYLKHKQREVLVALTREIQEMLLTDREREMVQFDFNPMNAF